MSQEGVERLIGRLFTDERFRTMSNDQLEVICREAGYVLSKEEFRMVSQLDFASLSSIAETLDGCIKRCTIGSKVGSKSLKEDQSVKSGFGARALQPEQCT